MQQEGVRQGEVTGIRPPGYTRWSDVPSLRNSADRTSSLRKWMRLHAVAVPRFRFKPDPLRGATNHDILPASTLFPGVSANVR
jgi:hypothetical protein